ncbi:hypothetical protein P7K49_001916 [Saguinus oedipus]|uniref:ABO, alpha 1-3-N-acetylgalactosaminyltransferase and alpha 1-3-galactosyltransferase n=1 Tax=Saguinus oedipus TaxID=9490 RepID=A0ABQ9WFU8_SAGOE|nr:hypothetical protein P7K49_001916 [Saguinus oedipus]
MGAHGWPGHKRGSCLVAQAGPRTSKSAPAYCEPPGLLRASSCLSWEDDEVSHSPMTRSGQGRRTWCICSSEPSHGRWWKRAGQASQGCTAGGSPAPVPLPCRYVAFVKLFLETAEKHFMVGHRVHYYIFTDQVAAVPHVALGAGRQLSVLEVHAYQRWQDVSMRRMEMISDFCERRFLREVDYLVCTDVDMKFSDHVGVEILSPLFGTLHPAFYGSSREAFTYERRPQSQAYIPRDEGDFYYLGGFFGGSVQEVQRLTRACHQAMMMDQANGIEAVWHDESHLNKYLLRHKPTKVLSPEYLWDQQLLGWPPLLKKLRFVAVPKNHQAIRNP